MLSSQRFGNMKHQDSLIAVKQAGPTDIVAIAEASDHESMRNIICYEIKTMKGVSSNTTLYCYPKE